VKKSTQEILHQAGIGDWLKSLKDTTTDLVKGKPSIRRDDVESLKQFQGQSQALSEMLDNLVQRLAEFKLAGNWGFDGEGGKTTLENTADYLKHFTQALKIDYEVRDDAPGEDVK
jgi:hypothetical protein